jgi:hypothetical protein
MKAPPPPVSAKEAKLTVHRASAACRAVRIRWTTLRASLSNVLDLANGPQNQSIGELTAELWIAERVLAEAAAGWRRELAEREALPVADRWNLVDMERWASAQPLV